jgi:magnesium-transporting ATPase (P-type)
MIDEDRGLLDIGTLQTILRYFTVGIAIVMVAVPEGLPLAISISMAFSVDTMKKDNLLVKNIEAPETLGFIREICTGKTATLTENNMNVNQFFTAGRTYDNRADNNGERPQPLNSPRLNQRIAEIIKDTIILNTDARIEMSPEGFYEANGNGTEVAMLRFL